MQNYKAIFSAILILVFGLLATGKTVDALDFWYDDFVGTAGNQPIGWSDETEDSTFNAEIAFSFINSYAAITRTAEGTQGRVDSPLQSCNTNAYRWVEINVSRISSGTSWRINIQDNSTPSYWPLNSFTSETGTFAFNYRNVTGWSGNQNFYIYLEIVGAGGKFIEVDFVRICDDAVTPTYTNTMTFTPTPTFTPSSTETPDWTSTFTPTATPTQTQEESTQTFTPTATPTQTQEESTQTFTPTATRTRTPDLNTSTCTPTATRTRTPDLNTPTSTPTATRTSTEVVGTPTNTPVVSPVPTNTPMATATEIPPGVFNKNLEFIRLNRKTITPDGSMDRELEIYFRSKLFSREIKISIFDINGRRQDILEVMGNRPDYRANWNGNNELGQPLPAGIYIYEIKAGDSAYRGAVVLAR